VFQRHSDSVTRRILLAEKLPRKHQIAFGFVIASYSLEYVLYAYF